MLFPKRLHHVADIASIEDLAEKLTQHTWTLCTGFRLTVGDQVLLFLNDSTSADGAQEYAVLAPDGRQLESITFGWCDRCRADKLIRRILAGGVVDMGRVKLRLDEHRHHVCHLCR